MKASRQFQKQSASSATPISQTSKRLQTRPFRDPNAPTTAQPSQSSLPATDYDPSSRPAWCDRLTFNPQRPSTVQTKLTVGAPNDQYEQEADRVADQVMSMPDAATQQPLQREALPEEELQTKPLAVGITPLVQREALPEEEPVQAKASGNADIQRETMPEDEEVQAKPLASGTLQREAMAPEEEDLQTKSLGTADLQREALPEEEDALQTKSLGTANLQREALPEEDSLQTKPSPTPDSPLPTPSLESQLSNTQGSGSPLPNDVRSFMEPRFGADFSQVRVHTGSESVQMNRDLDAQAFTHKQDVYFGAGKIPGNDALTAHELTHVVQQTNTIGTKPHLHPSSNNESSNISRQFTTQIQRKFIAKGDVKGFKQLINPIISGSGTEVKIYVAPQGNVSLIKNKKVRKAGPPTREAGVLASLLEKVINDSKTVRISFTNGSKQIMGGSYNLSEIDLEDVWAFGADSKEALSAVTILVHEIEEQYQKQVNGKVYGGKDWGAHGEALKAEAEASGAVRENEYSKDRVENDDGTINEKQIFVYRYPDGSLVEVVATFDHGNIVDVQRNKKE